MRVGDSFVDVPPSVLRSLFFPQRRSYIWISCAAATKYEEGAGRAVRAQTTFEFRLYNEGPATAEQLLLQFRRINGVRFFAPMRWDAANNVAGWRLHYPKPVHPGDMIQLCHAAASYPVTAVDGKAVIAPPETVFEVQIFATDQVPQQCRIEFTANLIVANGAAEGMPSPLPMGRYR